MVEGYDLALGMALYDEGQWSGPAAEAEQVVAIAPEAVEVWLLLGQARFGQGQPDTARAAIERALALDSTSIEVRQLLQTITAP